MAIRLPLWMTPPHTYSANKQRVKHAGTGTIINAEGVKNTAAWGKRSTWVDYHGPKDGKVYGVAIFDHPSNPRHPTWWHVRDYALFAANPFGKHDFREPQGPAQGGRNDHPGRRNGDLPLEVLLPLRRREGGQSRRPVPGLRRVQVAYPFHPEPPSQ